jgi:hypothetical protein
VLSISHRHDEQKWNIDVFKMKKKLLFLSQLVTLNIEE